MYTAGPAGTASTQCWGYLSHCLARCEHALAHSGIVGMQHNFLGTLTVVIGQENFGNVHVYVLLTLLELLYLLQMLDLLPPAGPRRVSKYRRSGVVACVISYAALACYGHVA